MTIPIAVFAGVLVALVGFLMMRSGYRRWRGPGAQI
jgi:hypothetical protein